VGHPPVADEVGESMAATKLGPAATKLGPAVAVGAALGVEAYALIDAYATQMKADAEMKMQGEINRNIQQINKNNQAQQEQTVPSPEMSSKRQTHDKHFKPRPGRSNTKDRQKDDWVDHRDVQKTKQQKREEENRRKEEKEGKEKWKKKKDTQHNDDVHSI